MSEEVAATRRLRIAILLALCLGMLAVFVTQLYFTAFWASPIQNPTRAITTVWRGDRFVIFRIAEQDAKATGLQKGDQVLAVRDAGGREWRIRGQDDLGNASRALRWGEPWEVTVLRDFTEGRQREVRIQMPAEPRPPSFWQLRVIGILPFFLLSLLCLATALIVGFAKAEDGAAYTASLLFVCVPSFLLSLWGGGWSLPATPWRETAAALWIYLHGLTMVLFMRFFLLFPCSSAIERKAPWLKRWGLVTSLIFATWNLTYWYATQKNRSFFTDLFVPMQWLDTVQDILYVALFLVGLASLGLNLRDAKTPDERRRLGLLLGGSLGILPCLMYWLGTVTAGLRLPFILVTLMLIFSFSFPVCFLVAIVKHRIFGIRFILRRGLQFALLSRGVLVLEGLAIFLLLYFAAAPTLAAALGGAGQSLVAIATAGAAAAAVMGIRQINRRVMPRIEKRFFREAYDTRRILTGLTLGVRRFVTDPEALAEAVTRTVSDALHPAGAVLFLRGSRALELPWDSERIRALRRDAAGTASGDFLLVWPRDIGGGTAVLRGGSLTVRLLEECAMGDPSVLDVDAGRARSRWPLIRSQGSEEEKALLEGLDAHLLVPMAVEDRLTGFLLLGDKLSEEPYSREDGELLLAVAQQAADTLDHAGLLRQSQEQSQLKREVEIAMQVQENLLPREVIPVPNIEYAGACRPARYVGGDYYDFILRGGGRLVLALGDISGKGVSAALLMANLQANLRVQADLHGDRLEDVVSAINQRLCAATGESRFATLFYGIFDSQKRTLDYVNAGHNPPILYRASAGQRALSQLDPTGSILGIFGDLEYRRHAVQLEPGDLLLVYSDGATEAMNEAEEFYGEERLRELVLQLAQRPPREVVEGVLADVARFSGEHAQADDITLIAARIL